MSSKKSDKKLPWTERYRAKHLDDIIGQDDGIIAIRNLIKQNSMPHWLFYGPPGTGKTSLILAIARELYGDQHYKEYIKEINASSDRGIDTVRCSIGNFLKTKSDKIKLVILDEFDAMTFDAQSALRWAIERYSKNNRFCLICNNINKVIPAIQSRCVKMRFSSLGNDATKSKINMIVEKEGIKITNDAIDSLVALEKDFRQVLNLLQGMHFLYDAIGRRIERNDVYKYLGKPDPSDIEKIENSLLNAKFSVCYNLILNMFCSNRWNISDMIQHLCNRLLTWDLPIKQKNFLIEKLAEIDFRVRNSRESEIQLAHLVSSFVYSRSCV